MKHTERLAAVLAYIEEHGQCRGYAPAGVDLAKHFAVNPNTAQGWLKALEEEGRIVRHGIRNIQIVQEG
jgi:DNA-binding MarR family transcriptional regulator